MQPITIRVFVSSTWLDLQPERTAVQIALQRMRETKFVGMEYFGSRGESTDRTSLEELDRSQLYIGIFGGRYGSGITEAEYRRACGLRLPCFIYSKEETNITEEAREKDIGKVARLSALKEEVWKKHTVSEFASPEDLAAKVTADLHRWLFDTWLAPALELAAKRGDEDVLHRLMESVRDQDSLREALANRQISVSGDMVKSLLVTGSHNVINFIVRGVGDLPFDYAPRIQNFLAEYLGSPNKPTPFGGRETDLACLDAWLNNPQESPYLLLVAPAGRGKSALLARWSRRLIGREDVAIVFFPVSARFRTNLSNVVFPSLTARLANLHGDKVPDNADTPAEVWRGLMASYLARPLPNGRRLILILDGLDEAADWTVRSDLFPLAPPQGLRVLLSARPVVGDSNGSSWLRHLGWQRLGLARTLTLDPLSPEGVSDVLRNMGVPLDNLAISLDIVAELHRLSGGDPLLVRLYVDELWARGETATRLQLEDLQSLRPGLEGYFEQWWDDQKELWANKAPLRERAVQTSINLLSIALGPLSMEDIICLAPPGTELNSSWAVEEALRPLARFVIGDGRESGYVFSHPRLSGYFYDRLSQSEKQYWEQRFLEWGKKTIDQLNKEQLEPKKAHAYLVQYYGAHLERIGASIERLTDLLTDGWRRSWESLDGTYAGFLNDLDRAWRAAGKANQASAEAGRQLPYLSSEVRCALIRASVYTLAKNIPPELKLALVDKGIWTPAQALAYTQQTPDLCDRARSLAILAPHLSKPLLQEALRIARAITNGYWWVRALEGLVPHFPQDSRDNLLEEALQAIRLIDDNHYRVDALIGMAPNLSRSLLEEALQIARAIDSEYWRADALTRLTSFLPNDLKDDVLLEAVHAVQLVKPTGDDAWWAGLVQDLASQLPIDLKDNVLQEALQIARTIDSEYWRSDALARLIPLLPHDQKDEVLEEALQMARSTGDDQEKANILTKIAQQLPQGLRDSMLQEALQTVRAIGEQHMQVSPLKELAPYLSEVLLQEALQIAHAIGEELFRAEALSELVPYLSQESKDNVFQEVLKIARAVGDAYHRSLILRKVAPHLSEPLLHEALRITRNIGDERQREKMVEALSPYLSEPSLQEVFRAARECWGEEGVFNTLMALVPPFSQSLLQEALKIARAMEKESWRAIALSVLAPYLQKELKDDLLKEALGLARTIGDSTERAWILLTVVPHLSQELKDGVLQEALQAVSLVDEDEQSQAMVLVDITPYLAEPSLGEALQIARSIDDGSLKVWTLAKMIPHLQHHLEEKVLQEAFQIARSIGEEFSQAHALIVLAPHLSEHLLQEALKIARAIRGDRERADALAGLAPYLPDDSRDDVIREALQLLSKKEVRDYSLPSTLGALAPHLTKPLLQEALQIARAIEAEYNRAEALAALIPNLPQDLKEVVLEEARALEDSRDRARVLSVYVKYLGVDNPSVAYRLCSEILRLVAGGTRPDLMSVLCNIFPTLKSLGGTQVADETARAIIDVTRWWP